MSDKTACFIITNSLGQLLTVWPLSLDTYLAITGFFSLWSWRIYDYFLKPTNISFSLEIINTKDLVFSESYTYISEHEVVKMNSVLVFNFSPVSSILLPSTPKYEKRIRGEMNIQNYVRIINWKWKWARKFLQLINSEWIETISFRLSAIIYN